MLVCWEFWGLISSFTHGGRSHELGAAALHLNVAQMFKLKIHFDVLHSIDCVFRAFLTNPEARPPLSLSLFYSAAHSDFTSFGVSFLLKFNDQY